MSDLSAQLRRYGGFLDSTFPDVQMAELRRLRLLRPETAVAERRRRGPLVLAAAAMITLLLIGGAALLIRLFVGSESPVVTTVPPPPSTTVPATTTMPAPTTTEGAATTTSTEPATTTTEAVLSVADWSFPAAEVPPFHATIAWDRNPDGEWRIGYQGSTAVVEVWSESPLRFRWQLVELDGEAAGDFIVSDGEAWGQYMARGGDWLELPADFHYPAWMFWEPEPGRRALLNWSGRCGDDAVVMPEEEVAGRATHHLACTSLADEWELWVDAETGLVLRMLGETEIDDQHLGTSPAGGFEVTSIEFFDGSIPGSDALFSVAAPEGSNVGGAPSPPGPDVGAIPPLHVVITEEYTREVEGQPPWSLASTREIWWLDPQTWREDWLAGWDLQLEFPRAGSYTIAADGVTSRFEPFSWDAGFIDAYRIEEDPDPRPPVEALLNAPEIDPEACTVAGIESVAGRPTSHIVCEWAERPGEMSIRERWIDLEAGLWLRASSITEGGPWEMAWTMSVLSIEFDPAFPGDIFEFTADPGWCDLQDTAGCERNFWAGTLLEAGMEVPTFQGQLADGTDFELTDLRGRPAIVFYWMTGDDRPDVLEQQLADFEALFETWGDRVGFVSIADSDPPADVQTIAARNGLTHDVVVCDPCTPYDPGDLWEFWPYSPAWMTIDADGYAVDLIREVRASYDEVEALITAVLDGP